MATTKKRNLYLKLWDRSPVVTIIGTVIVGYFGYKGVQRLFAIEKKPPPPKRLPTAGSGIPLGWVPTPYTNMIYKALDGWITSGKERAYITLLSFTDDQLTAVYNDWNRLYQPEEGTLTDRLIEETLKPPQSNELISRLRRLRLE